MEKKTKQNLTPEESLRDSAEKTAKPPVVVVLGHIDHGKTTLLNCIRKIQFTEEKPGGAITQHIGAYQIKFAGKKITFIDTPGHEAFSAMRSRGAKVADMAVLIIDAAEGIRPQTKEVISNIKKAQIPFIVALNKTDKPEADSAKVKRELQKEDILVEDLGGKVPSVETSAKTGKGIDELLDLISLLAEMENLQTDIGKNGEGVVVESYLDSKRGPTVTFILTRGVLKKGDIVGTPSAFGKIKILENFQGKPVEKILPADPAIVIGFEKNPKVGESFRVFSDIETVKKNLEIQEKKEFSEKSETESDKKTLNLILKTDVLGSIEAVEKVLEELSSEKVILEILKSGTGEVNESDINLAGSGRALVLSFRTKINPSAKKLADKEKIKIMKFEIIYDLVEAVRKLTERMTMPEEVRKDFGKMRVLAVFLTEKNRQIIGGKVTEGEVKKGLRIEVLRGFDNYSKNLPKTGDVFGRGRVINLQRNKKEIEKIGKGEECGILYEGNVKIEKGDILVFYTENRIKKGDL